MKRTLTSLVLGLSLLVASGGIVFAQDFRVGLNAYVEQNYATALRVWRPLAKQGNARAQRYLGWMYLGGEGVTQDYKKAVKWLQMSAEQGDRLAQVNLGAMYYSGHGVTQDFKKAVRWYRKSAEQGFSEAQINLGAMYYLGQGVLQDNVYAHMWLNIGALTGTEDDIQDAMKYRNNLTKEMTKEQLAEAQALARECVKKNYKGC